MKPVAIQVDLPPFNEALVRYRSFLSAQGFQTDIHWLFREDAIDLWPQCYVKVPIRDEIKLVKHLYDQGVKGGIGVEMTTYCLFDGSPCCYVWTPKDEEDASYRMLSGLKLCVQSQGSIRTAVPIQSGLRWRWLKWCESRSARPNWAKQIPSRPETHGVGAH